MSSAANGAQTAVVGTEHTLTTQGTAGTYQIRVDLGNMEISDELELRAKVKVLSGGTAKLITLGYFSHKQTELVVDSVPIHSPYSIEFSLKQTAGTARNFDWNCLRLDA